MKTKQWSGGRGQHYDLGKDRSVDPAAFSLPAEAAAALIDEYMDAKAPSELRPPEFRADKPDNPDSPANPLRCGGRPGARAGGYPRWIMSLYT